MSNVRWQSADHGLHRGHLRGRRARPGSGRDRDHAVEPRYALDLRTGAARPMTRRRLIKILIAPTLATGVSLLLYTAYLVWDPGAAERQHQLATQLENSWRKPLRHERAITAEPRLITGEPFAFIQIPRFGPHWRFTIVEGTALAQLATGPGHVPGTQLPGQRGNFAVAAHDITAGNPFLHLRDLRPGDRIVVTTRFGIFRYRVT